MVVICVTIVGTRWSLKRKPFLMVIKVRSPAQCMCVYVGQYHITGNANRDRNSIHPHTRTNVSSRVTFYTFPRVMRMRDCIEQGAWAEHTVLGGLSQQHSCSLKASFPVIFSRAQQHNRFRLLYGIPFASRKPRKPNV